MSNNEGHTRAATPLRAAREARGLTTYAVADAVGVNQSQYTRVENARSKASPELANRLAKFFGNVVTRDQILFPEDYAEGLGKKKALPSLRKAS
jgi:transcriptional regulator with XRE-family HTH domain